jgi:thiosulfate dehydrogenase
MTYAYTGPHAADRDTWFAGNNLACGNCHLKAETKEFGLPIFGLASDFPRYCARTGPVLRKPPWRVRPAGYYV